MVSTFGWLDTDSEQRRKMLEVVDLFKENDTIDELGIGSIRDALADSLFPGTSYLHTRLRYVLFIPWLLERASTKDDPSAMAASFRKTEYWLISSLLAGGMQNGVVGRRARNNLKRMPSGMYWATLGAWGIRTDDLSVDGFFRHQHDHRQLAARTLRTDDPEARDRFPSAGLDPHLPPAPKRLLDEVSFELEPAEEQYLSDRIATSTSGSMLAWLVRNEPGNEPGFVWEIDNLREAPEHLRDLVEHARRFHTVIHGAALLYNVLLARKSGRDELVADYENRLDEWRGELAVSGALDGWRRQDWWATIRRQNPQLRSSTVQFVDRWINQVRTEPDVATHRYAIDLIATRERTIKGGRARLVNQAALDRWSGGSGLGRQDFRWTIARPHLADLYAARTAS